MKEMIPQYEPTGKKVNLEECVDIKKTTELIKKIEQANILEEEKRFLILAAYRHLVFNYKNIAEYYCNSTKDMQKLMEDSGLVIIDVNDAILNGFVKLYDELDKGKNNE